MARGNARTSLLGGLYKPVSMAFGTALIGLSYRSAGQLKPCLRYREQVAITPVSSPLDTS
jgi:hypothetical protein